MSNLNEKRGYLVYDNDDDSVCSSLDGKEVSDDERHHFVPSRQLTRTCCGGEWDKLNRYCRLTSAINMDYEGTGKSNSITDRSYFKFRCKQTLIMASDILSSNKQVRWADDLVDVYTYSTPRIRGWELLRKKLLKTLDAIKQDIDF